MKKFKCHKCFCYLGDMEKGKIHKKAVILCEKCMNAYKILENLSDYKKHTNANLPEGFEDLFKGFQK